MEKHCAICEDSVFFNDFFCKKCYTTYKEDIYSKVEWIKYLYNLESKRRRDDRVKPPMIYLGDKWDIDNDGNLVHKDGATG